MPKSTTAAFKKLLNDYLKPRNPKRREALVIKRAGIEETLQRGTTQRRVSLGKDKKVKELRMLPIKPAKKAELLKQIQDINAKLAKLQSDDVRDAAFLKVLPEIVKALGVNSEMLAAVGVPKAMLYDESGKPRWF